MKYPITIKQAIEWLQHQKPRSRYHFTNNKDSDCLFSQMIFGERRNGLICMHGRVYGTQEIAVPFHDAFWDKIDKAGSIYKDITRERAIKTLKSL